jgi:diaminohydroxyphosphoribosylaminopyrimidine deaminase/5-amino-6-(5-phosphoribosylamino)uracil reductase
MTFSSQDHLFMQRALELAESASYITSPNPRVGCVLVGKLGSVIGEGHTQKVGAPHAEVMALAQAAQNGADTKGATVYVTLEPCAHTGRTPPCTTSLIQAGVSKVIASHIDPNPKVSGVGFETLRAAGIQVQIGLGSEKAIALNEGFVKRMTQSLPLVRLKIASSIDGATALQNGASQWITGESARKHAHTWRARSCALITGIGTVLSDDPSLNVRFVSTPRQPKLVIVDANLDTPTHAKLFEEKREVIIYCARAAPEKQMQLTQRGALIVVMPDMVKPNHIDLMGMLADLATKEINEIHIEAGQGLNTRFIELGLVDEYLIYLAPLILGDAKGWTKLPALDKLSLGKRLSFLESMHLEQDIFIRARPTQATHSLSVPQTVLA